MSNIIEKIDYFSCGYCTNDMQKIFKGVSSGKRNFHGGVFLIKHKTKGYILYDTGYSMKIFENNLKYKIYTGLNPVTLKKEDIINEQLKKEGIGTEKINYIILSHLHPDHIGGAKFFSDAQIIITDECFQEYKKSSFKSLIFKEILPENFEERLKIIEINSHNSAFPYIKSHDLFNDGSLFLSRIDGHAKGQGCLFIPEKNLFLAADVCWGIDLLELTDKIKFIPRLIQNNFSEYKKGVEILKKLMKNNIDVIVSHDMPERIRGILNEKDS
ncbi:MBL fold metallo-hydrolase [Pseudoleptotrichia goodfellowii]|uniref:Metallo-beta-lactamase domain protein n=1 Tax=Pseudoleptotrichia goodfellowii F0264 TaxID=596323 RepID=D0GJY4_9FUSO|nr:MBL fold metallo-hydrolase [Pseudoleptotrichia goodfellowii]EEY35640.1 metallo-beta-lactamase domain protein [Pseudoleptotrichia goodfellowii F0264]